MKKLVLISILFLSLSASAQQRKDEYKDYKVCTECFQADKWQKTGLDNYGMVSSPRQSQNKRRGNGYLSQTGKTIIGGVAAIIVGAITLSIYNSVNNATSHIH